jgi:hypothetical protein
VFISTSALVPILLLEPPHRISTAWTGVSPDRRPLWLALGHFLAIAVLLLVPTTRTYLDLTAPDPPVVQVPAVAVVVWFVTVSLGLRFRVLGAGSRGAARWCRSLGYSWSARDRAGGCTGRPRGLSPPRTGAVGGGGASG